MKPHKCLGHGLGCVVAALLLTTLSVLAAAPTVTGVSPAGGSHSGGTVVTITGASFTGATAVNFGGTPATSFTVVDDTHIQATSPAGTGTVDITITTPAGTSATSSADQLTYIAAEIYVRASATGSNNGTSWTNAFTSLQSGLAAAAAGDEIWVAAGTYKPTSGADRTIAFVLKNGVALYGGFAGTETALGQRNIAANVTILSGDIGTAGNNADNSYHVVYSAGCDSSALLDGFTITGGNANAGTAPDAYGGGMYNEGSPTVTNCTFSGNWASSGGGILNMSGSPAVTNCTFTGNAAGSHGGGMLINSSTSPAVTNCTFSGNSAADGGAVYNFGSPTVTSCTFSGNSSGTGGGMYNASSSPTVTDCTFSSNRGNSRGGGMYNDGSSPTVTNCTFSDNWAGLGGGMGNYISSPVVTNCTFNGNGSPMGAGMCNDYHCSAVVTNCVFSGNTSEWFGGGIYNMASSPAVTNCTFSGNTAASTGGGMCNFASSPVVTNCTFSGNSASTDGGGMYSWSSWPPALTNCIFWGDTANGSASEIVGGGTVTYSCVQGGYTGVGNISADPLLANAADGDLRLLPGSPCIDTADAASAPATDIRGLPRVGAPDMGAYECQGFTLAVTGGSPQSAMFGQAFATPLSLSVSSAVGEPVAGGVVTFTVAPAANGASATLAGTPATIQANGTAQVTATANGTAGGPYAVAASTPGALNTVQFDLTNDKLPQTTTFDALADKLASSPPFAVSATSSSGLPVSFSIVSGPATITGDTITLTGGGTVVVQASQAGDDTYLPAPNVDRSFYVRPAPTVTAGAPSASGAVPLTVAFTASGSGADGDTVTYSWDFGDGSPVSTEQNPTHTYVTVGTYTATVTVSDGKGGTATASVTVTVGFVLYTVKTTIRLNFARPQGHDSITMTGVLHIPAGFSMAGQTVVVDVGGVVKAFTLDGKGASPKGNERFTTKVRARSGVVPLQEAKFTLTMKKGTYAATLLDDGLVNEDVLKSVTVPETVIFNGEVLRKAAALMYRGHKGQTGLAR